MPAGRPERRLALAFVLASTFVFLVLAPIATRPLAQVGAFIPAYEATLALNDVITATILLAQFGVLRMRGLLLLACAYLFTAALAIAHLLSFPGLLSPTGLLGAGNQTTVWLYMFWHTGFPILVIVYALTGQRRIAERASAPRAMLGAVAATLAAAAALTLLTTSGHDLLPVLLQDGHYQPMLSVVVTGIWSLCVVALLALARRRPYSVLDLWLIVVVCAWLFDIGLSAGVNAARFDLGFYAGRIYGLISASFILLVLLARNGGLYARLVAAHETQRQLAAELQRLSSTDGLTGLANRRAFDQAIDSEWRRTLRYKTPLSLLVIDVDHFKRFNDTYGHVAGDECLRRVAEAVGGKARRAGDLAARYGGEEFVVLLPHTETVDARRLAERICEAVRELRIPHAASMAADHVTVSVGVAGAVAAMRFDPKADARSANDNRTAVAPPAPATLVANADRALYAAKATGRNRACMLNDEGELDSAVDPAA
ncbi:MAG: GGDEF domain-containing protein [Bradyrhizobium sp.]|nr:MAG: GGDEF domain-containing protein [Bradyrhizobium sp.]